MTCFRPATADLFALFAAVAVADEPAWDGEFRSVKPRPRAAVDATDVAGQTPRLAKIDASPSVTVRGGRDLTIRNCELRSIRLLNCKDVRVLNCWIHDSTEPGVVVEGCENVLVQGNRIERVATGVYALDSSGVQVVGNYVADVVGPMPRGQMTQFNKVTGAGNAILGNRAVHHRGRSLPEDAITLFQSFGTPESPILVEGNRLEGDPAAGSEGKRGSGSGIMLGDGDGGGWIVCRGNVLVAPGQVGIGVAGGSDVLVEKNVVWGEKSDVSNVGIYVWNQSKKPGGGVTVRGNRVAWVNKEGKKSAFWNGDGFSEVAVADNVFADAGLPKEIPPPAWPAPLPPLPAGKPVLFPWPAEPATER